MTTITRALRFIRDIVEGYGINIYINGIIGAAGLWLWLCLIASMPV